MDVMVIEMSRKKGNFHTPLGVSLLSDFYGDWFEAIISYFYLHYLTRNVLSDPY